MNAPLGSLKITSRPSADADDAITWPFQARSAAEQDNPRPRHEPRSWPGDGSPLPLTAEAILRVLTSDQVRLSACGTGLRTTTLLPLITRALPQIIERLARTEDVAPEAVTERYTAPGTVPAR